MVYEESSEVIAFLVIVIIFVYLIKARVLNDFKTLIFTHMLFFTAIIIAISFVSCLFIENYQYINVGFNNFSQTLYFLTTPLMTVFFAAYSIAYCFETGAKSTRNKWIVITSIPYLAWVLFVLFGQTIFHCLFYFDDSGYHHGPLNFATYIVFFIYCLIVMIIPIIRRKHISKSDLFSLVIFPWIAFVMIVFQWLYIWWGINVVYTGSAAAIPVLIIYLYLQRQMITIDDLTGLPNQKVFTRDIADAINAKKHVIIGVIRLNFLAESCSRYGQINGDIFIKQIANYLRDTFIHDKVYCYRNDEFAFILSSEREANDKINEVAKRISEPWILPEAEMTGNPTVGVIYIPDAAKKVEDVINLLQIALVNAFNSHETIVYCDKKMKGEYLKRVKAINELTKAIDYNRVVAFFQPIYSVEKNNYIKAEALVRIYDENQNLISPSSFIEIAEETGQIEQLDLIVFKKSMEMIKKLFKNKIPFERISVNFTASHFLDVEFSKQIITLLDEYQVNPANIAIEITERVFLANSKIVTKNIKEMVSQGITFYLDDFGTGFSNLALALSMPFDTIKIDKSLIDDASNNSKSYDVLYSLTDSLLQNDLKVVAEGVENDKQIKLVKDLGITNIQGFYYSKPIDENNFLDFLKKKR